MIKIVCISIILLLAQAALAEEVYYYSRHPEFLDKDVLVCDSYVRNNAKSFKVDMKNLVSANNKQDWKQAQLTLAKYGTKSNLVDLLDDKFIKSVTDCGSNYKFSNGVNYYRELFKDATIFLLNMNRAIRKQKPYNGDIQEDYEFIIHYLNIILNSTNKTANKSFNPDGANNAPPG